ncbi:transcriptional regulator CysB-like protein [Psychromonas sp. CNPT3]|uniref:LysR substrate-binding domain-containing protein n=1 Tax=Psychromonas sp. CNPT3 TaxID=314282 RepID=UPI00006E4860|nr:LysR substrate-binding domain-containing protein [Psychromonas sp. CNPT3]AGH82508.1 transcriptional regulator CysB-like protein [Psychromonas sp. CNPT3]
MKLKQLHYLKAIINHDLNISSASKSLFATQPGVSKQIALLEEELGVKIFDRKGKNLNAVTDIGKKLLDESFKMLELEANMYAMVREHLDPRSGCLNIYTTNTIARFLLPKTVNYFIKKYPEISLHVGAAHPDENGAIIKKGHSDFSIVAQKVERDSELIVLPAYKWSLSLILPAKHPLCNESEISLEKISQYSIISYEVGSTGRIVQDQAFAEKGLKANYVMTVMDVDVIKKYVSMDIGIGIVASIAALNICDEEIVSIPLEGIFSHCDAWICYSRNVFLQKYMYDFIESFSPHLTKTVMQKIAHSSHNEIIEISKKFQLPNY